MFSARKQRPASLRNLFVVTARRKLRTISERSRGQVEPPALTDGEAILDLQQKLSPHWHRARHFRRYAAHVERGVGGGLRVVFSAPPQHGKTEITLAGLLYIVLNYPTKRHAYVTYNQDRAFDVSADFKRYCEILGITVKGTKRMLRFPGGGKLLFTSIEGGITGQPVDGVVVIDDPFKDRSEADSAARRAKVDAHYRSGIETRVHPGGSIFLLATRWHPQDLSGTLIKEGWEYLNLPAIAEHDPDKGEVDPNGRAPGEALFPELWPTDELQKKREKVLEFTWAALYQGRPRPAGGTIFGEAHYYTALPTLFRPAFGVDLAYSTNKRSDWSICLELWREDRGRDERGNPLDPNFYVVHVDRRREEAPAFTSLLKRRHESKPQAPMLWRASGTEKGSADFIRARGVPLATKAPNGDKIVTSMDVAAAWNAGRVFVPDRHSLRDNPLFHDLDDWIDAFLDTVANFTGTGAEHDDDVDALGNAHHLLASGGEMPPPRDPERRRHRSEARNMAF